MAQSTIGNLFGRSPIQPVQAHMDQVNLCVAALEAFFDAALNEDWPTAKQGFKHLVKMEREADKRKMLVRQRMPNSLFLPVPRNDLLQLIDTQDVAANLSRDIAGKVLGRHLVFPEALHKGLQELLHSSIECSEQANLAINELDELLSTGFSGPEIKLVEQIINQLDQKERQNDKKQARLRARLLKIEHDLYAVDVVFMYQVIEQLGNIADATKRIGNRLRLLMAK